MLSELDKKMDENGTEAFIVYSFDLAFNEDFFYLTRSKSPSGGFYIKAKGKDPLLLVSADFEKETVKKESIVKNVKSFGDFGFSDKFKKDPEKAYGEMFSEAFESLGISKETEIKWHGQYCNLNIVDTLREEGYTIKQDEATVGSVKEVKEEKELAWIRKNAEAADRVLEKTFEYLKSANVSDGTLTKQDGAALTVGDVKRFINLRCTEEDLYNPAGLIVAPGEEGAEPHSLGTDSRSLMWGEPILIDFFPKSLTNGYWYDTTRTVVVGKASPEVKEAYDLVIKAQAEAEKKIKDGVLCSDIHNTAVDVFKEAGKEKHFVHALGHGVGTGLHEAPHIGPRKGTIKKDSVITNEPGLYFEGKFGIRIEDTLIVTENGTENLTKASKKLEL